MREQDLAYAAGIIDGEGSIGISRRKSNDSYLLTVQVSMTNDAVPEWLHRNFGGNIGTYQPGKMSLSSKPITKWAVFGTRAQEFLRGIYPYLHEKERQASVALTFPIQERGADKMGQSFVYDELRVLNRRP